jgi:hypothetical protein
VWVDRHRAFDPVEGLVHAVVVGQQLGDVGHQRAVTRVVVQAAGPRGDGLVDPLRGPVGVPEPDAWQQALFEVGGPARPLHRLVHAAQPPADRGGGPEQPRGLRVGRDGVAHQRQVRQERRPCILRNRVGERHGQLHELRGQYLRVEPRDRVPLHDPRRGGPLALRRVPAGQQQQADGIGVAPGGGEQVGAGDGGADVHRPLDREEVQRVGAGGVCRGRDLGQRLVRLRQRRAGPDRVRRVVGRVRQLAVVERKPRERDLSLGLQARVMGSFRVLGVHRASPALSVLAPLARHRRPPATAFPRRFAPRSRRCRADANR